MLMCQQTTEWMILFLGAPLPVKEYGDKGGRGYVIAGVGEGHY